MPTAQPNNSKTVLKTATAVPPMSVILRVYSPQARKLRKKAQDAADDANNADGENELDGRDRRSKQIIDIATPEVFQNKGPHISLDSPKQTPQNRSAEKNSITPGNEEVEAIKVLVKPHGRRKMAGQ